MRAIDLAEILWTLIRIVEVQHLLSWDDRVEIAEDEEYGKMPAEFLEDA